MKLKETEWQQAGDVHQAVNSVYEVMRNL